MTQPKDSKTEVSTDLMARREVERIVCAAILKFGRDPHAASAPIAEAAATEILSLLPSPTAQGAAVAGEDGEDSLVWALTWARLIADGNATNPIVAAKNVLRFLDAHRASLATPQADVTGLLTPDDKALAERLARWLSPLDFENRRRSSRNQHAANKAQTHYRKLAKAVLRFAPIRQALASQRNGAGE